MKTTAILAAFATFALPLLAQGDGYQREGKPAQRVQKDALEGKAPPALQVTNWLNTDGLPLDLAALRGKVVLLDFWGTW